MDDAGDWCEEVEVVVLLRDRPLKTDNRLGLDEFAVDLDREWTPSLEPRVEGRSSSREGLSMGRFGGWYIAPAGIMMAMVFGVWECQGAGVHAVNCCREGWTMIRLGIGRGTRGAREIESRQAH